jgi:hypothetical protein
LRHLGLARRLAPDAPARQAAARQRHDQMLANLEPGALSCRPATWAPMATAWPRSGSWAPRAGWPARVATRNRCTCSPRPRATCSRA